MFGTICDINGLHFHNPLFYTESYLQSEYVKANDLARHIHLFRNPINYIDYTLFNDLKGIINTITEIVDEKICDGVTRSESSHIYTKKYYFNRGLELCKITMDQNTYHEVISLSDSLKMPKKLQVLKFFDNKIVSKNDIVYNEFLEFDQLSEITFYDNKTRNWTRGNQRNPKYHFDKDGKIHKIYLSNDSVEQSKTTTIYNSCFQVLECKTYHQKYKSELLYEAMLAYNNNGLQSIKYIRHKPSKSYVSCTEEFTLEYNEKGMLEYLFINNTRIRKWTYDKNGNPISEKSISDSDICGFEKKYIYQYDHQNNWTFKCERTFIDNVLKNETQINRGIEYY